VGGKLARPGTTAKSFLPLGAFAIVPGEV